MATPRSQPIDLVVWNETQTRIIDGRPLKDICQELNQVLEAEGIEGERFSRWWDSGHPDEKWPKTWHWIACYAVTGDSEGHFVHVDVIAHKSTRKMVLLCKTLDGMKHAYEIAKRCAELLGA